MAEKQLELGGTLAESDLINLLYYGAGGTGKTTAAVDMANHGKILVVNAESGLKRAALKRMGIKSDNIRIWPADGQKITFDALDELWNTLREQLEQDPKSWYGVVWDSITEIAKLLIEDAAKERTDKLRRKGMEADDMFIDRADYGNMTEQMRRLVRKYRDLPCHFVATALPRRDVDDDGSVIYRPALTPALGGDVYGYMDAVIYTDVQQIGGKDFFRGLTRPVGKYQAKDRFGVLPKYLPDATFSRISDYVEGMLDESNDKVLAEAKKAAEAESKRNKEQKTTTNDPGTGAEKKDK